MNNQKEVLKECACYRLMYSMSVDFKQETKRKFSLEHEPLDSLNARYYSDLRFGYEDIGVVVTKALKKKLREKTGAVFGGASVSVEIISVSPGSLEVLFCVLLDVLQFLNYAKDVYEIAAFIQRLSEAVVKKALVKKVGNYFEVETDVLARVAYKEQGDTQGRTNDPGLMDGFVGCDEGCKVCTNRDMLMQAAQIVITNNSDAEVDYKNWQMVWVTMGVGIISSIFVTYCLQDGGDPYRFILSLSVVVLFMVIACVAGGVVARRKKQKESRNGAT